MEDNREVNIGKRVRQLRKIRNISLQQFAEETEMSYSYLSGLENGKHSISINTLQKLAEYFQVDLMHFLKQDAGEQFLIRAKDGNITQTAEGIVFNILTPNNAKNLQVSVVELPTEAPSERHIHKHKQGEEFIYVLEGSIMFWVGDNKYTMNQNDSIFFDASTEHVIYTEEGQRARILLISSPPNGNDA